MRPALRAFSANARSISGASTASAAIRLPLPFYRPSADSHPVKTFPLTWRHYCPSVIGQSALMIFQIDFKSGTPVYLQLVEQIRHAAASGGLRTGEPVSYTHLTL